MLLKKIMFFNKINSILSIYSCITGRHGKIEKILYETSYNTFSVYMDRL